MGRVTRSALRASLVLLGAAAVASGCAGAPEPVVVSDATLRLRLEEYRIVPAAISVRAGVVRIAARNAGRLTHNVKVEEDTNVAGVPPRVFGEGTKTMQPGEIAPEVDVRLAPGRYRLVCTIGNHDNLGQYAELEVTAAGQ